jgi:two-component system sensor histidine kinase ChvG
VYRGSARGLVMTGSDVRIEQLLDKLVENARDFTPAGGTITLSLERSSADLLLRVCNDGPPLPEPIRGQLFDSMLSLRDAGDPQRPHPGIGLFVARAIAEAHGGGLTAANRKDGGGAEFIVRLAGAATVAKT